MKLREEEYPLKGPLAGKVMNVAINNFYVSLLFDPKASDELMHMVLDLCLIN